MAEHREQPDDGAAEFRLTREAGDRARLVLGGRLDVRSAAVPWRELEKELGRSRPKRLEVDATGVEHCDGAGLALLQYLQMPADAGAAGGSDLAAHRERVLAYRQRYGVD